MDNTSYIVWNRNSIINKIGNKILSYIDSYCIWISDDRFFTRYITKKDFRIKMQVSFFIDNMNISQLIIDMEDSENINRIPDKIDSLISSWWKEYIDRHSVYYDEFVRRRDVLDE